MREGPISRSTLRTLRWPVVNRVALGLFRRALRKRKELFPPEMFVWCECMFVPDLIGNFAFDDDGPVDSFRLAITNNWFDQRVNGVAMSIDGRHVPAHKLTVRSGDRIVPATELYGLDFPAGPPTELIARDTVPGAGLHVVEIELTMEVATLYMPVPIRMIHGQGEILTLLADPPARGEDEPGPVKVHYVPHIHHDVEWLATRGRFETMSARNLLEVLRLLDTYPDYTFTLDQIPQLEGFRKKNPGGFEALRKHVEAGRVEIVNGLVAEPDTNLVAGESLVMGSVLFQRWAKETFGRTSPVGWLIDSFGMSAQLPQILTKSGTEFFAFSRTVEDDGAKAEFVWEGLDGSKLVCHYMPLMYFAGHSIPDDPERARVRFERITGHLAARSAAPDLLLPAGIDHGRPQDEPALRIPEWNERHPETPIAFSTPTRYFRTLKPSALPIRTGELQREFPGVWSIRPQIKKLNRRAEALIEEAEKLACLASLDGRAYPADGLDRLWRRLLACQFHDRICSCLTDEAAESTTRELEAIVGELDAIAAESARFLAAGAPVAGESGARFVAFNTLSFDRSEWIELEFEDATGMEDCAILSSDGPIAHQVVDSRRYSDGRLKSLRIGFVARIPAMGYRVFRFAYAGPEVRPQAGRVSIAENSVTTGIWSVGLNAGKGTIRSVESTRDKLAFDLESAGGLILEDDGGDAMASDPRAKNRAVDETVDRVLWTERGPLAATLRTEGRIGKSRFVREFRFYSDLRRIDVTVRVDFRDAGKRLRAKVGVGVKAKTWTHEVPYGAVQREGRELPALRWADAADKKKGVAILNDAIPGHELAKKTALLSLLRSKDTIHFMDAGPGALALGKHEFRFAILPHAGDWKDARLWRRGRSFAAPLRVVRSDVAGEDGPGARSLVTIEGSNVVVTAMRRTAGGPIEMRLVEQSGRQTRTSAAFHFSVETVEVTDMLGNRLADLPVREGRVEIVVGPHEILTLRLTVAG